MEIGQSIAGLDLVSVVGYLLGILALGIWVGRKRGKTPTESP